MQGGEKKTNNHPDKNPEIESTVTNVLDREEVPNGMGTSLLNDTTQT